LTVSVTPQHAHLLLRVVGMSSRLLVNEERLLYLSSWVARREKRDIKKNCRYEHHSNNWTTTPSCGPKVSAAVSTRVLRAKKKTVRENFINAAKLVNAAAGCSVVPTKWCQQPRAVLEGEILVRERRRGETDRWLTSFPLLSTTVPFSGTAGGHLMYPLLFCRVKSDVIFFFDTFTATRKGVSSRARLELRTQNTLWRPIHTGIMMQCYNGSSHLDWGSSIIPPSWYYVVLLFGILLLFLNGSSVLPYMTRPPPGLGTLLVKTPFFAVNHQ
jgi:hypothetical protein